MTKTQLKTLNITSGLSGSSSLSKGQKAFNTLIKQIDKKRTRLKAWQAALPTYRQKYAGELDPLLEDLITYQVSMVHRLDQASAQKGLSKIERRTLSGAITDLAGQVIAAREDADMKAIYNRHSESDYDAEEAASIDDMKSMLEDVLGFELGDDLDMRSPQAVLERAKAQLLEQQTQHEANVQARQALLGSRKKTAKQLAREAQQQAEEKQLRQSVSEIYRKLVSALHPDRETDPEERERKTFLMQRVNDAYGKNNLLQLLELQLELEHIDQAALHKIGEDRLKHYNKILKEQLTELDLEIMTIEEGFRADLDLFPFEDVSPTSILRALDREIVSVQKMIRELKRDVIAFEDINALKVWLKALRHQSRMRDRYDSPF